MTIRHIRTFIKVAELGSISRAAEELCIAQPSVSETIKDLEDEYGIVLFNRINRKLVLTKEGEELLLKAKEINESVNEFETLARKEELNPIIRIGATITFGAFVIPNYTIELLKQLPTAIPKFSIDKPVDLEQKIVQGTLDFAFEEGNISNKKIKMIKIGEDELIAVCAPSFNAPEKMKIEDLINYELLLRESGNPSRRMLDYQLGIKGIKLGQPRIESVSNNVIISMAMNGLGIGILPNAAARRAINNGFLRRIDLDTPLKRPLYLICHRGKKFNKLTKKAYLIASKMLEKK